MLQIANATALYYLRARYYDPTLGRFLTPDPLPGSVFLPQSLNRYPYAGNDPVNRVDPSGLVSEGGDWEEEFFEELIFQECAKFLLATAALVAIALAFGIAPLALPSLPLWLAVVVSAELEVSAIAAGGAAAGVGYSSYEVCTR